MYLSPLHCCMFILIGIPAWENGYHRHLPMYIKLPWACTSPTSMWSDPIHADSQAGSDNVSLTPLMKTKSSHLTCVPWAGI